MSIVLRSRKTLEQRYRNTLRKYGTLSHLWDFGVAAGPLAYAATHTAAEFLAQYPLWHLYQDTAGTIPACKITDPVGLCLDTGSGSVTLGPELVTNGGFTDASGWTTPAGWSIGSGVATATATNASLKQQGNPFISGNTYCVKFDFERASGTLSVRAGVGTASTATTSGPKTMYLVASGTTGIELYGGAVSGTVDNISVREVIGNHASQTTPTKRGIMDASGVPVFDGADDTISTASGGANSTAAFLCIAFNTSRTSTAQTLWSDRTGNTGLKLEITAANALVLSGGNGSSINTATGGTVTPNAPHIATAKYDGTTLSVQLDSGTVGTAACALSAGTAVITMGMDNGAVTAPYKGVLRKITCIKGVIPSASDQQILRQVAAASIGVTL